MRASFSDIGRIVISKQGHDIGRWYIVTECIDADYVQVCDGKIRPFSKPKKKRTKHLQSIPLIVDFNVKGASGGSFDDSDLRRELSNQKLSYQTDSALALKKEECAFVQE